MACIRELIDISAALLTPIIAILAAYIAWQQWHTNRNKLKLDLFDRRFQILENVRKFIAPILTSGTVEHGADIQFLRDTKSARFLFQDDAKILSLINEIYERAVRLDTLEKTEKGGSHQTLTNNLNKQNEIKEWYAEKLTTIDDIFKKYLILKH
jgi:hypothetical protein